MTGGRLEYQDIPSEKFYLTGRGNPIVFQKNRKSLWEVEKEGASIKIITCIEGKIFNKMSHRCRKKLRRGNPIVFHKIEVSKKFMHRKRGRVSRYYVENFLSHTAKKN